MADTPIVLIFKDEGELKEIEILGERLVDKKTKEALARVRCEINFELHYPHDRRTFTLYGCRLAELRKDETGEITGFTIDYDKKVYDDDDDA